MVLEKINHSSGLSQTTVISPLDEEVLASVGSNILITFPTADINSLLLPLNINFLIGEISFNSIFENFF